MSREPMIGARPPRFANWLMDPIRANRSVYAKVALAAVMINLFALVASLFTMTVYNRVIPNNATSSLIALTIGLAIMLVFDFILKILRAYFVDIAGADIDSDVGDRVFAQLLTLRMDQKRGSTGGLASLMRELETLRDFFASATLTAVVDVPFILITLLVMALIGGWLVLVPIALIPIVVIVGFLTEPTLDRLSTKSMSQAMLKQSVLVETIGGLEMVKSVSAAPLLIRRWRDAVALHARTSLGQRLVSNISVTVVSTGQQIAYAAVVVAGVGLINAQELSIGALIACSILSGRAVAPLAQIANLLSRLNATRTAYRQLNGLMDMPIEGAGQKALKLDKVEGGIEFKGVTFTYPGATETTLKNVSLTIKPGEKVAILGRVGSGKSTIARMILGLYPPETGLVMVDGTEVRQLDMPTLRKHIGCVMQDTVLLSGSVRENIQLDRPDVDDGELLRAAALSGTHEFMGRIANGYDLVLTDRGESLSGGQRQSIGLARALAGKPSMLILDEPSSAMDSQTEVALLERLAVELKDRTLLLITHRMPLLRLVSRIILLDQGKIVADGPRDAILKQISGKQVV
ncbi:MAG: type I secretion system permease/ATPase [Sphingomonadaceae bacterium]